MQIACSLPNAFDHVVDYRKLARIERWQFGADWELGQHLRPKIGQFSCWTKHKKKTGKPEANQINCAATRLRCRSIRQMAAHFVFIKGIDEGAKAHVWPDGGINFYFNEKFFCTVVMWTVS